MLSVFTRDFGLITATAPGIRLEKSKLRYSTQDYTLGEFSLVRGKEFWRLTSAQAGGTTNSKFEIVVRVAKLLKRFLQGEEPHPELFDCVDELFDFLDKNPTLSDSQTKTLESLVVFRIMHALGYIAALGELREALSSRELSINLLDNFATKRVAMNKHINQAIQESHL